MLEWRSRKWITKNTNLALGLGSAISFFGLLFEDIYCFSSSGRGGAIVCLYNPTPLDFLKILKEVEGPRLLLLRKLEFRLRLGFGEEVKMRRVDLVLNNEELDDLGGIGFSFGRLF